MGSQTCSDPRIIVAYIGKQYSNTDERYWVNTIDEIRIYDRALSEQEISGL